ncbi:hypothetical protein KCP73_20265 [Salmonella enterica subsp. enterica]|nr:hypothetical protein KCP73_20265 [Salmonella enterica subsp. enterica]
MGRRPSFRVVQPVRLTPLHLATARREAFYRDIFFWAHQFVRAGHARNMQQFPHGGGRRAYPDKSTTLPFHAPLLSAGFRVAGSSSSAVMVDFNRVGRVLPCDAIRLINGDYIFVCAGLKRSCNWRNHSVDTRIV